MSAHGFCENQTWMMLAPVDIRKAEPGFYTDTSAWEGLGFWQETPSLEMPCAIRESCVVLTSFQSENHVGDLVGGFDSAAS